MEIFQRQHGVTVTGVVDRATYEKLFSDEALTYMADLGISGSDVEDIQSRLRELDYLDKVTGYFGEETEKAVIEFQKNNRLSVDGKVGTQTREMLYSEDAVPKSLKYGEKSDDALRYQKWLNKLIPFQHAGRYLWEGHRERGQELPAAERPYGGRLHRPLH